MAYTDPGAKRVIEETVGGPIKVTLGAACKAGDALVASGGKWQPAASSSATEVLWAGEAGAADQQINAFVGMKMSGYTDVTPGSGVMLGDGGVTTQAATGKKVGVGTSATTIYVGPSLLPVAVS